MTFTSVYDAGGGLQSTQHVPKYPEAHYSQVYTDVKSGPAHLPIIPMLRRKPQKISRPSLSIAIPKSERIIQPIEIPPEQISPAHHRYGGLPDSEIVDSADSVASLPFAEPRPPLLPAQVNSARRSPSIPDSDDLEYLENLTLYSGSPGSNPSGSRNFRRSLRGHYPESPKNLERGVQPCQPASVLEKGSDDVSEERTLHSNGSCFEDSTTLGSICNTVGNANIAVGTSGTFDGALVDDHAKSVASDDKAHPSVEDQIARKLKRCLPNIFKNFYITDLGFPRNPISSMSRGLIPDYGLCKNEAHYLESDYLNIPWQIQIQDVDKRKAYRVVLQGDLFSCAANDERLTHRFVTHLDLTSFIDSVRYEKNDIWKYEPLSPDPWLDIALGEMRKDGHQVADPAIHYDAKRVSMKDRLDISMSIIKSVHQDFFLLGLSDKPPWTYEISHISRSMPGIGSEDKALPDLSKLAAKIAQGESFSSELVWGSLKRVYCVPLFGPKLNSWLCFLVDASLPIFW